MLMNPNQETWASPKVYKLTWWLVVQQALACLINQNQNFHFTPPQKKSQICTKIQHDTLFLYYDNWTDVTTMVVGTEQTML
jgi:hypothetical protein